MSKMRYFKTNFQKSPSAGDSPSAQLNFRFR